jgi:hypothetical protein
MNLDPTNLDACVYWVLEREQIRLAKEGGAPWPWTDDPILKKYRFCCVRREDDRVTEWIHDYIREPYADHPNLWFMLCAARVLNWPSSLSLLMDADVYPGAWPDQDTFSPTIMGAALEDMARQELKVFTGAYMITAPPDKGAKKTLFVANVTLGALWQDREGFQNFFARGPTFHTTHERLTRYNGWGPFMAYQVIIDLRHTRYLKDAPDRDTWAAAGPGTLRGLNRVFGRHYSAPLAQAKALEELRVLRPVLEERCQMTFELSEVTGIMCETDKFLRIKNNEGTVRATYVPGRGW